MGERTVLELGRAGSSGVGKGVVPVLAGDAVVATLRASNWKEAAAAEVGDRAWVFQRAGSRALTGRWAADPEDAVRVRAQQVSAWKGTWAVDLDGAPVEVESASRWKSSHRFRSGGQVLAESGTTGRWSARPTLSVEPGLPLDHAVFLLWFELVLGRRFAAAAAAV
jgi:hypothetical protein